MDLNKDQLDILEFIKERKNVFITGGAGTGKSFLLKKITEYLKEAEKVFAVTAMTGSAAILINGRTLHSTLGIGLAKCDPIELLKRIIKMGTIYNYLKSLGRVHQIQLLVRSKHRLRVIMLYHCLLILYFYNMETFQQHSDSTEFDQF